MSRWQDLKKLFEEFYSEIDKNKKEIKDFMGVYDYYIQKDLENRTRKLLEKRIIQKEKELSEFERKRAMEGINKIISIESNGSTSNYFKITTPLFEDDDSE